MRKRECCIAHVMTCVYINDKIGILNDHIEYYIVKEEGSIVNLEACIVNS